MPIPGYVFDVDNVLDKSVVLFVVLDGEGDVVVGADFAG